MKYYTSREIKPLGWLKQQLQIEANGLCGNLDKVWPSIRDSAWIGGDCDSWERVPYWLDGFIPLAYLLEDEDLISRVKKYVDAIISRQQDNGWICPCGEDEYDTYDTWAVQLISKVLVVYYQCSHDERIPDVLYRMLKNYYELLSSGRIKLLPWGIFRWYETCIAINFIYERTGEDWLIKLAEILREQGADYESFSDRWKHPLNRHSLETHIVNLCMMLKSEAVSHKLFGEKYTGLADRLEAILTKYNGTPTGNFNGDECLAGLSPIQGAELCSVVELMYSYEILYAETGDQKWADLLEKVSFNAYPASVSDDMWTHQYHQMSNQVSCEKFGGRSVFRTSGDEAHLFGLEPNFGCCTANFGQGWPKLALSVFMHDNNTVQIAHLLPCELKDEGLHITLDTMYPFRHKAKCRIDPGKAFKLQIRIPSFARKAVINGVDHPCGIVTFDIEQDRNYVFDIELISSPVFVDRPFDLKVIQWGPLVFSLPVKIQKIMKEYTADGVERKFPYCDYEYKGVSDWNFGYAKCDPKVEEHDIIDFPFSSEHPPVTLKVLMKPIDWGYEDGFDSVCAKVPNSREPLGQAQEMILYPYGCAKLRLTEIPIV